MPDATEPAPSGKRVAFVELYLDLVFVLAVAGLAALIEHDPEGRTVWIALGLFVALWWTWIGFAVAYNRAPEDAVPSRLLLLAGSVPIGVAAVAIEPASHGDTAAFAIALGVTRVILACAPRVFFGRRIVPGYLGSAALFLASAAVPEPYRYVLWAFGIGGESRNVLVEDKAAMRRARQEHDWAALKPEDPSEALDAHHFAERFGLFLIILLGELIVGAGSASAGVHDLEGWATLVAAMVIAGGLWWLYFDSAADLNRRGLELSGGSPAMARAIFAGGHMLPSFALLLTAAGVGLLFDEEAPKFAYVAASVGIGMYMAGTRVIVLGGRWRPFVLLLTFFLGRLHSELSGHEFLWLLAVWVAGCAALTTGAGKRLHPPPTD